MAEQDLQLQAEKLKELRVYLEHLKIKVHEVMLDYRDKIGVLRDQGLPKQIFYELEKRYWSQRHSLANQNDSITDDEISFVMNKIQGLEQLFHR